MTGLITLVAAELRRLRSTRLWCWALGAALVSGSGLVALLGLVGPEHFQPPMPGLDTPDGVRGVLGMVTFTVLLPAVLGTVAMTSEYRHGTITVTFLCAPRRWRALSAKLVAFTLGGACYGTVVAISAGVALYALPGPVGLDTGGVLGLLVRLAVAMVVYTVLGVGIGALVPNQVAALAIVLGYLYFVEVALLAIPGVNVVYPYLPGGATAALTGFTYVAYAVTQQAAGAASGLLSGPAGALLLAGYGITAAALALAFPLRRDIT